MSDETTPSAALSVAVDNPPAPEPPTKNFRNHKIILNERNWEFVVEGPEFPKQQYTISFKSYDAAREEINKRCDETLRLQAKKLKFSFDVFDQQGSFINIDKLDRRESCLVSSSRYIYPNVPWVANALKEAHDLRQRLNILDKTLHEVSVDTHIGYGRVEVEEIPKKIESFRHNLKTKTELAFSMVEKPKAIE
jgi:hypothetical protein